MAKKRKNNTAAKVAIAGIGISAVAYLLSKQKKSNAPALPNNQGAAPLPGATDSMTQPQSVPGNQLQQMIKTPGTSKIERLISKV